MIQYLRNCLEESVQLAASTSKKVVVRRFDREPVQGFVNPQSYIRPEGVEVLSAAGAVLLLPYDEVKAVYFVKDFDLPEAPAENRVFNTRPKISGVWVRLHFRDGEIADGILANNLLQMDPYGFTFVPPNPSSAQQKVFAPRAALTEVQVLGVVGSPLRTRKTKAKPKEQIELFE